MSLVYEERVADRGSALRREAALKRLPRAEKLRLLGAAAPDPGERTCGLKIDSSAPRKWTVPPVYRAIVKKNERQAKGLYDVLICGHAVLAAPDNTFRKARPCAECRVRVQEYADQHTAPPAPIEAAVELSKARPRAKVPRSHAKATRSITKATRSVAKAPRGKAEVAKSAARAKPAPPARDVARAPRPARRRAAARA